MRPAALGIGLGLLVLLAAGKGVGELLDGVAAIIGDEIILISELNLSSRRMTEAVEREQGKLPPEAIHQIRKEALQRLIDDRLIGAVATRLSIETSEEEIDEAIEGIARSEDVSVEQVYGSAASEGLSRERYRAELANQITRMKVISSSVRSRVTVIESEVQELYNMRYGDLEPGPRVRVRHILLPWPQEGSQATREDAWRFANEIRERALASEDFPVLARTYSAAPSAQQGGLTVFKESDTSNEIKEKVFHLEPGAISPLIETEHGINLFQMLDRFDPSETKLEDVHESLEAELIERKMGPEFESWMSELRKGRYIEIVLPDLQ
jgi:peptidyl-prolyl cis-trans isomerase SurA